MSYSEEEGNNNIELKNDSNIKKKNRTLQFYKFLFYSIKTEIKLHDFVKLFRFSNAGEIALWIMSLILYISTPKDILKSSETKKSTLYNNIFIWFHIIHVIRAALGIFLIYYLPRSFEVINTLESYSNSKFEKTLFNDLIRETIFFNVTERIKPKKKFVIIYLTLTLLNLFFDLIDFFVILTALSKVKLNARVILLSYFLISILYIYIDISYVFWFEQLKYVFPKGYLRPIESVLFGFVDKALIRFKLRKPKTDIVSEANAQKSGGPYVQSNDMKNGGINVFENILRDSFGVKMGESSNRSNEANEDGNKERYPNLENNPPGSEEQIVGNKLDV